SPTAVFSSDVSGTPGMSGPGNGSGPTMGSMGSMTMAPPEPGHPAQAPAGPNAVNIDNFAFAPDTLTVPAGTTVTWTNHDEDPHNVVAEGGQFRSPTMGSGATFSYVFAAPGTFTYVCGIHPFMHGTVVVR
ncbi:cupredoxin family copper-binding protein, partial [Mycolicibacterium llatzerense]|uniref:cupredoxin domain-containing protein n=1 Tax=Mycolicibacterium llatzerense TaxID=280871 RepID=UPI000A6B205E